MKKITYKTFNEGAIGHLKDLCNALMHYQGDHATMKQGIMKSMNFENRLLPEYEKIKRKFMVVAYDKETPIGFAFSAVTAIEREEEKPKWAEDLMGQGFYPTGYPLPKTIGTFKLLYVRDKYRGLQIGQTLSDKTLTWLKSHKDVEDLWVYVANGNEKVGSLYEKLGFTHSHSVWGGFIEAYSQKIKR